MGLTSAIFLILSEFRGRVPSLAGQTASNLPGSTARLPGAPWAHQMRLTGLCRAIQHRLSQLLHALRQKAGARVPATGVAMATWRQTTSLGK